MFTRHLPLQRRLCQTHWSIRRMSVQPGMVSASQSRKKVTIQTLHNLRKTGTPITMVTAYDYPSASALSSNPDVDIVLIGDSLAQVCLGYEDTNQLTLDEMIHHCAAVARGSTHPFRIADMPFGTFQTSQDEAARNAIRLVREGRVEGVKLEGGREILHVVKKLCAIGIPVCAHIGLLPQRHVAMSGYKVQGKDIESAERVYQDALAMQEAGAFAIVVEAVPQELSKAITEAISIPTIGIGAGKYTSGQVLVWDDILGTWPGHKAKFVRQFGNMKNERDRGLKMYTDAVRERSFPTEAESYAMQPAVLTGFLEKIGSVRQKS
ncbi:ketopantoate hydroxymethyltransferase [Flagelloscypha sp. PMI_526]|nr:ketopantoate hydroxymethyltransferase [Flagelloscypha sp. PMI_526]